MAVSEGPGCGLGEAGWSGGDEVLRCNCWADFGSSRSGPGSHGEGDWWEAIVVDDVDA